jgi:uncharacterized membrane protein YtjA (UPF0391 family)
MLPNSLQRSRLLFRQLRPRIRPWSEVWLFDRRAARAARKCCDVAPRQQPDLCLKLRCMLLDWKMNRDCQMGAAFLISIVAGVLGFTGISAASANIAGILFYIFAVIFLVLLILGARGISGLTTANVARSRSGQMRAQVINRSRRKRCRANL